MDFELKKDGDIDEIMKYFGLELEKEIMELGDQEEGDKRRNQI